MTWLGDTTLKDDPNREKLEAQRAKIIKEIEVLSMKPLPSKSVAAAQGRQEDLLALAKKVKAIDKKLGRL